MIGIRRRTVRFQLTALYGTLFVVSGALLLGITYWLVASRNEKAVVRGRCEKAGGIPAECAVPPEARNLARQLNRERTAWLHHLLTYSGVALGVTVVVSIGLSWLAAGRVLRPLRRITATARSLSTENLHERIGLTGPDDELKELGDTFDAMLARLDGAFDAQRRFIANASHELRTPLTVQRAAVDVALADRAPTVDSLRTMAEQIRAGTQRQERLIESLLALARGQRGVEHWDRLDLADIVGETLEAAGARPSGLRITQDLAPAAVLGDRTLLDQLTANLVDNATRHNVPGGWVSVRTDVRDGRALLRVANSGPVIEPDAVESLFQPFRRLGADRTADRTSRGSAPGVGLGLSIVAAIAAAHHGTVAARPLAQGGLEVVVMLPAV
jgi:signal transduction histidine kinase